MSGIKEGYAADIVAKIDRTGYGTMTVALTLDDDDQHRSHNLALDAWLVNGDRLERASTPWGRAIAGAHTGAFAAGAGGLHLDW